MLVEVYGYGGQRSDAHDDLLANYAHTMVIVQEVGIQTTESRPEVLRFSDSTGETPIYYRSVLLRDNDERKLNRVYAALRKKGIPATVPAVALLPRDSALAVILCSLLLGFGILEIHWSESHEDPIGKNAFCLLVCCLVSGLLAAAAILVDSTGVYRAFLPLVLATLMVPSWRLGRLWRIMPKHAQNTCALISMVFLIDLVPMISWGAKYVFLRYR